MIMGSRSKPFDCRILYHVTIHWITLHTSSNSFPPGPLLGCTIVGRSNGGVPTSFLMTGLTLRRSFKVCELLLNYSCTMASQWVWHLYQTGDGSPKNLVWSLFFLNGRNLFHWRPKSPKPIIVTIHFVRRTTWSRLKRTSGRGRRFEAWEQGSLAILLQHCHFFTF